MSTVYDGEKRTFRHRVLWEFEESVSEVQQVVGGTEAEILRSTQYIVTLNRKYTGALTFLNLCQEEPTLFVEEEDDDSEDKATGLEGRKSAPPRAVTGEV